MKYAIIITVDAPCHAPRPTEDDPSELEPCASGRCAPGWDDQFAHAVEDLHKLVTPGDEPGLVEDIDGHLGGEGEYAYLAKEHDREHPESDPWWAHHAGQWEGYLTQEQMDYLLTDAYWDMDDVLTIGTLTFEGLRPDIVIRLDSQSMIADGRITPYPEVGDEIYPKARAQHIVAEVLVEHGINPADFGCDGGWEAVRTWVLTNVGGLTP